MLGRGVSLIAVIAFWTGQAHAMDAGVDAAVEAGGDGGQSCADSSSCAPPTPYCDPTRHVCVECLSYRNCPGGEVCEVSLGTCVGCRSDADCPVSTPYCSVVAGKCVECITSANCGSIGLVCQDSHCGWCGDGICGPREILADLDLLFGGFGSGTSSDAVVCPGDCAGQCPTRDLGSALGSALATVNVAGLRNLYVGGCGMNAGPDASFAWKAPHDGTYYFSAFGSTTMVNVQIGTGDCTQNLPSGCSAGAERAPYVSNLSLNAGDPVFMVFDTDAPSDGDFVVSIWDRAPPPPGCDSSTCGSPEFDGGPLIDPTASCLDNARARGEVCAGTDCACNHCPQDYDACAVIPGCAAIQSCMGAHQCIGADCYLSGQCRSTIDSYGGVSAPAFQAASGLQSCELTFVCPLPCADGGSFDAGSSSDAGRLCMPGRTVTCNCGGGKSGTKTCAADGNDFGACTCGAKPMASGGCNCQFAAARSENHAGLLGLAMAAGLGACRARRRRGRGRNQEARGNPCS